MSGDPRSSASRVDVVVVSYRQRDRLLACCASVEASPVASRLIVVDNASDDDGASAVRRRFPAATVLEMERNEGFAVAVNHGVAAGGAPFVLLLNNDARLRAGSLEELLGALAAPAVGAAGPRLIGAHGETELSIGRTMGPLNDLGFRVLETLYRRGRGPLAWAVDRLYDRPRRVRSLTAACLLLRRQAWDSVGGMDERFFLYAEDVDLCRRLRDAGWELRYVPTAIVDHDRGASAGTDVQGVERHHRASQLAFYRKHHGRLPAAILRAYLVGRYLLRAVISTGDRRRAARTMLRWLVTADPDARPPADDDRHERRR